MQRVTSKLTKFTVCGTASIEAADETAAVRKNRGFLIASV